MNTTSHKNEDDLTQKIKMNTILPKKGRRTHPKDECDLTQIWRRPHPKMKTTSPKNEDDLTQKWGKPTPKNEDNLSQKFPSWDIYCF